MEKMTLSPALTSLIESRAHVLKLALIQKLFDMLHQSRINYCHWKSSEHLYASMLADTDLDILFEEKQEERLKPTLDRLGFKKFKPIKQKQYKDIEDFIALDVPSGKIIHLHAHFKLTLGEAYLKSYQLDLEDKVLRSRVFDEVFHIYRIAPAFELTLLYFRLALKTRNRDVLKMHLRNKIFYTGNILKEYKWLKQRCTEVEIEAVLKPLFDDYRPIYNIITKDFNRREILKLSGLLKKRFKDQRSFSSLHALLLRWQREILLKVYKKCFSLLHRPIILQRINPRGGLIVAVVGADGSGKSTVIANLQSTFRKKIDVYNIYFGSGDGRKSWLRKIVFNLKRIIVRVKAKKQRPASIKSVKAKKKGFIVSTLKYMEALMIASEKRRNLKLMQAAKKKGMLVICDRFPQNQTMGYNDGPLLHHIFRSKNLILRAIAKKEFRSYQLAANNPPDVLFKLIADVQLLKERKPNGTPLEMLKAKIESTKKMQWAESCKVITVDAAQPLDKVLSTIKKEIWDAFP
jgi:thymidylate kinase